MFSLRLSINPISLDATEDSSGQLKVKLEEARNKAIIQEAEFTNDPLELCMAIVKTCIEGDLATKNRVLNKTIIKYFQEKIEMKISHEYFQAKPEPDYSGLETVPNLQQLILYGVDFLTTNAIRARLKEIQTQIKEIIWINDSTCKIVCRSEQEAQRILTNHFCVIKIDQDERDIRSWRLMKPYTIFSFDRNLWIRYATSKQFNVEKKRASKYDEYSKAKNQMALQLLEKFNAIERYKEAIEQIEEKKRSQHRRGNKNESQQKLYSRSRDKHPNRDQRHNQRALQQQNQRRRKNRFAKYNALSKNTSLRQQATTIRYEHVPIGKREHDTTFDQESKRISQRSNAINTDFQLNKQKDKSASALFDNISEIDSSLSFIFRGKDNNEQESRMDFQYQLRSQKQHSENSDGLQYQIQAKIQNKNQHNNSFRDRNRQFNNRDKEKNNPNGSFIIDRKDAKEQSQSDFFDFKDFKKEATNTKDSKLDNSFKYDKNQKHAIKKVSNHDDDESY